VGHGPGFEGGWELLRRRTLDSICSVGGLDVVRVRRASAELLDKLEQYDLEAFADTGLNKYDLAVMTQVGAVFLAYEADQIVGGCQLLRILNEPDFFYVVGFYLRPQWQGRHLGKAFLLAVADEAKALGARGLLLTVAPDNKPALGLYQSAGFVAEAFMPDFYGSGQDRHILRWRFA
jgi:ribosomal protein S18 acetylase RimI-like enzyme